ncbi:hypothetical protein ACLVWQ_36220 [Streptomyces sp. CWNU-52B]|uniref:hypothetical protein n=1 Tax=unclassified Streptomyces TaxID=2593676 RepID=UPI0039C30E18
MPENQTSTARPTELTSQYIAQVTNDLESNAKEQDRVAADIAALQEQLLALRQDHTILVNMQQALGGASPSARSKQSKQVKQSKQKKTAAPAEKKSAARKPAAQAAESASQPSLIDLIRAHLEEQNEPRSAAEVTAALTAAHPDRTIRTTVVRTSLENLVARSSVHRSKQGSSVFYTADTEPRPAATAG